MLAGIDITFGTTPPSWGSHDEHDDFDDRDWDEENTQLFKSEFFCMPDVATALSILRLFFLFLH
jgi:hypothetical protein